MGESEEGSARDVMGAARAAWFGELVGGLDRVEVYGMAIVLVDARSGEVLGHTERARALLGDAAGASLQALAAEGTIARPDLVRLARHLRALQRLDEFETDGGEVTHGWSDRLRIHRRGAASTDLHLEVVVHRRPAIAAEAAVVTLWTADEVAERSEEEPRDLEDLWAIYDQEFRMLAADPGFEDLGIDPRSQLGAYAWLYVHPDDVPTVHPIAVAVMDGRLRTARYSVRLRALRGRWLPVEIEVRRLVADDGPQLLVITRYVNAARRTIVPGVLSQRQLSVVHALFDGMRVTQIAEQHGVAVKTVRNQLAEIYRKLDVAGQVELLETYHRPAQPDPLRTDS